MMISDRAEERRRTATELEGTAVQVEWLIPGESPTDVCWYSEVLVLLSPRGRRVSGSVVFSRSNIASSLALSLSVRVHSLSSVSLHLVKEGGTE